MSDTKRVQPLKVWLVATAGDAERELEVEFVPDALVSDLVAALAEELVPGVQTRWILYSDRLDEELDPEAAIAGSGLVTGDRVELRSEARDALEEGARSSAVDLVVVGGPFLGTRYRLEPGSHLVGRGSGSDVKIEDPSMSRRHFQLSVASDGVEVSDAGSTNGTFIDGERVEGTRRLDPKDVIEAGGSLLAIEPALSLTSTSTTDGTHIAFNRPPRVRPPQRELALDAPVPPDQPTGPRIPLAISIVPLLIGIVMVMIFPENKAMLLFFAMTPVIAVWSFLEERRSGSKNFRRARDEYLAEVAALEEHLGAFVEEEMQVRRDAFPDSSELTNRVRSLSPRLWERRPTDPDFLCVRVGWGDEPSTAQVGLPSGGSRELRDETAERLARYATLRAVPVVVDLRAAGTCGLCGEPEDVTGLARWLILQLAALNSPNELRMAAVLSSGTQASWEWLKWVPHFGATIGEERIAFGAEALHLVEQLGSEVETPAARRGVHTVVFVEGDSEVPRSALARLLRSATSGDVTLLWLGRDPGALPGECRAIVETNTSADTLRIVYPAEGERFEHSGPEGASPDHALAMALALAPIRDAGVAVERGSVPRRTGLWEALDIADPRPEDVLARWRSKDRKRSVLVGVSAEGPLALDLRLDGPHALIGGTTGAGKSELLQSMIGALAYAHPPEQVNLLLIDYKGGTAFKDLEPLPHVVGSVTDLDGHLARRTLESLDAELKRREKILRSNSARDVLELEERSAEPLPDLVLIVDEFAALVAELPEFVDGIVDIAQRGRALGLHLILATQKPAGVINEKIRANTNLRISLRMSDEADSFDVIGLPDAAHIPRAIPGRGYVRTGHGEVTEFQSPYATAPAITAATDRLVVRALGPAGPYVENGDTGSTTGTQLELLVAAIAEAGRDRMPFSPVLPPLPDVLELAGLGPPSGPRRFPIGLLDEPATQRQQPYELAFERDGSALVYGTGGSGKTTLLRTIAASIAMHSRPDETHIYAIDFGTRGLAALDALPHCGSVVFAEEEERIRRLFAMLRDEIQKRRAAQGPAPDVVVLLDGYAGFAAAFERVEFGEMVDALPRLVADGRQVGIHFVITADRRGGVPAALTGIIGTRIVLRLADDDEYSALGLSKGPDKEALAIRGRAFLGTGVLMQCAVPGAGASATEQIEAIQQLAHASDVAGTAPPVRTLPNDVPVATLPAPERSSVIPIGLDERLETVVADLTDGHFLISGPRRSGRTTALASVATQLARLDAPPVIHLLAPRRNDLPAEVAIATETVGLEACERWISDAANVLGNGEIVLIDDGDEMFEMLAADSLQRLMKTARDSAVRFVVAVETHALHRAFGGWIAEVKKDKQGLLLEPDLEIDGDIFGIRLPRRKTAFPPGRGYLVDRGEARLIQAGRPSFPRGNA